jgi:two-component system response regulator AtoC
MGRILIVIDEAEMRRSLGSNLRQDRHEISEAAGVEEARKNLLANGYDAVLTDQKMADGEGLEVLNAARENDPSLSVVFLTAAASTELAMESVRQGAFDFLTNPLQPEVLWATVRRACEHTRLLRENVILKDALDQLQGAPELYGESSATQAVREKMARVAPTNAAVLITGETGTGKELVARAIHRHSQRSSKPFITLNCAAFAEAELESKLFGREKGASNAADPACQGLFEAANAGTLFLDEAGEMSLAAQAKLLRVLTDGQLLRVGATKTRTVDVRVLVATHQDLQQRVRDGLFREDLYYRLALVPIHIPPLRDRLEEIPGLCDLLSRQVATELKLPARKIGREALDDLKQYQFPGNVRELKNLIERAYILSSKEEIGAENLPVAQAVTAGAASSGSNGGHSTPTEGLPQPFDLSAFLDETEKELIVRTLASTGGAQAEAARRLGLSRSALAYKLTKYGIRGNHSWQQTN